tara:strand:- start:593 stop:694 length:102 start_codon:yes stop_codon:yes gene_type:complete
VAEVDNMVLEVAEVIETLTAAKLRVVAVLLKLR